MLKGEHLVLMGVALFLLIFPFHLYSFQLYEKVGKRGLLAIYFAIFFLVSIYLCLFRIFIWGNAFPLFVEFVSFAGVFGVLGQPLPLPSPSNSSSNSSQARWEAFDMGVLLESGSEESTADEAGPSNQNAVLRRNLGLEASIRSRISYLENSDCVFLLDKPKGQFWNDVKGELEGCATQQEYDIKVHFESRDLQVREQRHACYTFLQQFLSEHPALAESAAYEPAEAIIDFFNSERDSLDRQYHLNLLSPEEDPNLLQQMSQEAEWKKPSEVDTEEILFLQEVEKDLRDRGVNSVYIRRLLGHSDP